MSCVARGCLSCAPELSLASLINGSMAEMKQSKPKINISAWDNGSGLSIDIDILVERFEEAGCPTWVNGRKQRTRRSGASRIVMGLASRLRNATGILAGPHYDANIFVENIDLDVISRGRVNCLIPDPEWLHDPSLPLVARMDWVLCKTHSAVDAFGVLTPRVRYVGWTSPDRAAREATQPQELRVLHLAGQSQSKGTIAVVEVWRRHPEWPQLVLVRRQHPYLPRMPEFAPLGNVLCLNERVDDITLQRLQNECAIHLCPSEAEGFGHSIVEAMSCGVVVVTTDGAPMNELIAPDRGVLVRWASSKPMRLATSYTVDVDDLERQVARVLAMSPEERAAMGTNARRWYESSRASFNAAIGRFVEELVAANRGR